MTAKQGVIEGVLPPQLNEPDLNTVSRLVGEIWPPDFPQSL